MKIALLAVFGIIAIFIIAMTLCLCKISGTHAEDDDLAWELLKNQEERENK